MYKDREAYEKRRKEKIREQSRLYKDYRKEWLKNNRFKTARSAAKARSKPFELTEVEYLELVNKPCHYCQDQLKKEVSNQGVGLDRLDNSQGYISGNVVQCCRTCNTIRGDNLTPEEAMIAIQAVIKYRADRQKDLIQ